MVFVLFAFVFFFFFNDTATTEIYTLSLHDALPILLFFTAAPAVLDELTAPTPDAQALIAVTPALKSKLSDLEKEIERFRMRSEEHTSELQSPVPISYAVFCLKKKKRRNKH